MKSSIGATENRRRNPFTVSPFHRFAVFLDSRKGFTLLEVLVALALLGIAITIVLQLFSSSLRALSASEDYVAAVTMAEVKMRETLDDENLSERSWSELTADGYRLDMSVTETLRERTDTLQVQLMEVRLTIHWAKGLKKRSFTLKTLKVVTREI